MKYMNNLKTCFTSFKQAIERYTLPERFTFPFYYEPNPLCLLAMEELQQQLSGNAYYQKEFTQTGKMFGVLLVKNAEGEVGYLCGFSGKLAIDQVDINLDRLSQDIINFVPPVFDPFTQAEFYQTQSVIINQLNHQLQQLEGNDELKQCQKNLNDVEQNFKHDVSAYQQLMSLNRANRKQQRKNAEHSLSNLDFIEVKEALAKESVVDKNSLRDLKAHWLEKINAAQEDLNVFTDEITQLKDKRKQLSNALQNKLFEQYRFLNSAAIEKNLTELFLNTPYKVPPAGAGDCAAPKLLQYAFKYGLTPLAMAEFWWGQAPKSEIRQHKKIYGACIGKCRPILTHMLAGMALDEDPLLINPAANKTLEIVFQDDAIVVVNKPSGLLSVPGKNIEDSVYSRIKQQFPEATGTLIVHRLDMATSGLMVLALTQRAQKSLQKQFISRTIKKRYVALLEGKVEGLINESKTALPDKKLGDITLPLRGDFDDRPRQLVCFEYGKVAKTQWQVIEQIAGRTKLYLFPETGRTHQLRVHCAHPLGLNLPILGDDLYGRNNHYSNNDIGDKKTQRLHLHAEMLTLNHPVSTAVMTFQIEAEF
ncbi:MAG: tRNA pseudouridine32 synthase/23S rRNA pseudouridine746 synthase [Colwellia sp.]|jgi:tRNA pseudouridine32 synthase/23S rRNA pseudouridine746 synthase